METDNQLKQYSDQIVHAPIGFDDLLIFTPKIGDIGEEGARALRGELAQRLEWRGAMVVVSNARYGDFVVIPIKLAEQVYQLLKRRFGDNDGDEWKDKVASK